MHSSGFLAPCLTVKLVKSQLFMVKSPSFFAEKVGGLLQLFCEGIQAVEDTGHAHLG